MIYNNSISKWGITTTGTPPWWRCGGQRWDYTTNNSHRLRFILFKLAPPQLWWFQSVPSRHPMGLRHYSPTPPRVRLWWRWWRDSGGGSVVEKRKGVTAVGDSGMVVTDPCATPNEAGSQGTTSGGGPRRQETMGDTIAQTRFENISKLSNDPLLARGITLRSGEDRLKLKELMELCTNLQTRVLDLEKKKTTQAEEIVTRVESSKDEGLGEEDASKQGRIFDIDANKDIYLVNVHTDEDMFGVNDLDGDEVIIDNVDVVKTAEETRSVVEEVTAVIEKAKLVSAAKETVNAAATTASTASTIPVTLKSAKPKANKVVIQEPEQGTTTTTPTIIIHVPKSPHDKGKGIMVEEPVVEQVKPMKRLEQMRIDKELTFKLQAEEEERLAREKA
ncbi:hypothetical protein Tco_0027050 [Tanacetum coccineum]